MNRSLDVRRIASWIAEQALKGIIGNLAWAAVVGIVLLVVGSGAALFLFRSALSDFFRAEVRVWHLILVLLFAIFAICAWRVWWRSRGRGAAGEVGHQTVQQRRVAPVEVDSDGMLWLHAGWYIGDGPIPAPYCPRHRIPLMYKNPHTGELKDIEEAYQLDHASVHSPGGELFCPGPQQGEEHPVSMTESKTWSEAKRRASVRLKAKLDAQGRSELP
jgi:uncharacterized protein YhhL (DUF1145 family)